jgi:hypothetical protein
MISLGVMGFAYAPTANIKENNTQNMTLKMRAKII